MTLLTEKAETAKLVLEKVSLPNPPPMRVVNVFDVSYSAKGLFSDGTVQNAFDQFLGAAMRLDDNGEVDSYVFDNKAHRIATATAQDYGSFVQKKILQSKGSMWNGTTYSSAIELVLADMFAPKAGKPGFLGGLFGAKKAESASNDPVVVFFVTDGENDTSDNATARAMLRAAAGKPIYWFMIGIGRLSFSLLTKVADEFDNVGFIKLPNLKISDQAMYEALFTEEFVSWVKRLPKP